MDDKESGPKDTVIINVPEGASPPRSAERVLPPPPIFDLPSSHGLHSGDDFDNVKTSLRPLSGRQQSEDPDTVIQAEMGTELPASTTASATEGPDDPRTMLRLRAIESPPGSIPDEPSYEPQTLMRPSSNPSEPSTLHRESGPPPRQRPSFEPLPEAPETRSAAGSYAMGALLGLVAVLIFGAGVTVYLVTKPRPAPMRALSTASATPIESAAAPSSSSMAMVDPTPSSSAGPVSSGQSSAAPVASADDHAPKSSEERARAALARLRDGIDKCVKNTIHVLPGTSTPIPESIGWLKHGPYASSLRDWVGPFFACTQFKIEEPIPFMIQWQLEKPGDHGNAVAWIDDDADGKPEKAYGFTARLKEHDVVEFGEVRSVDPSRKVAKH